MLLLMIFFELFNLIPKELDFFGKTINLHYNIYRKGGTVYVYRSIS